MPSKSLNRTLILYLAYAFLVSSICTVILLFIEYTPKARNGIEKFRIGATILNAVLWSLLFTVVGATSLFNFHLSVRRNVLISLLSFILLPFLVLIAVLSVVKVPSDIFGFTETGIVFLITQLFFFFRFRSCINLSFYN
jgi:hypothetical protein